MWWGAGARHFLEHLVDGDIASNNHGWQWVAGTGTDASPYFRVFNPVTQGLRFDPDGDYVRRWVPELAHLPGPSAHEGRLGRHRRLRPGLPRTHRRPRRGAARGPRPARGHQADQALSVAPTFSPHPGTLTPAPVPFRGDGEPSRTECVGSGTTTPDAVSNVRTFPHHRLGNPTAPPRPAWHEGSTSQLATEHDVRPTTDPARRRAAPAESVKETSGPHRVLRRPHVTHLVPLVGAGRPTAGNDELRRHCTGATACGRRSPRCPRGPRSPSSSASSPSSRRRACWRSAVAIAAPRPAPRRTTTSAAPRPVPSRRTTDATRSRSEQPPRGSRAPPSRLPHDQFDGRRAAGPRPALAPRRLPTREGRWSPRGPAPRRPRQGSPDRGLAWHLVPSTSDPRPGALLTSTRVGRSTRPSAGRSVNADRSHAFRRGPSTEGRKRKPNGWCGRAEEPRRECGRARGLVTGAS